MAHSQQQKGVAERMNRTLMESARTMIAHAGLPNSYWVEVVNTAAYIRNQTPTTAIKDDQMPYERWYGRKPNVSHLKVFGCVAYAQVPNEERCNCVLLATARNPKATGYSMKRLEKLSRGDVIFNEMDFGLSGIKAETETVKPKEMI